MILLSAGWPASACTPLLLGMLAGVGRWTEYGALIADAGIRVVIAVATFLAGWGVVGYPGDGGWRTGMAAALFVSSAARAAARLSTPGGAGAFLRGASYLDRGRGCQRDPGQRVFRSLLKNGCG